MVPIEIGLAANKTKNNTRSEPLRKKNSIVFSGKRQYNSTQLILEFNHSIDNVYVFIWPGIVIDCE